MHGSLLLHSRPPSAPAIHQGVAIHGFDLECLHEALGLGVVIGIAAPAHGAGKTMLLQDGAIVFGGILRPSVGMMHATPWWIAGADGGLECSNSEPCIDRAADSVTYDPTGPSIEDRSQVHKAGLDRDVGDVGYPQLVRTIQFHVLRKIGEDRTIVIAIRRCDKTPALPWIQRMLAHEPADLLGVHDNAAMA